MRIFFDTSVLVAAIVTTHPAHEHVFPLLMQVKQKVNTGVIAAHSLAELYAILTRLPIRPRISPALALELIQRDVVETCEIVALSVYDYLVMLQYLTRSHIAGAAVYDGLLLHAAWLANVDQVLTLNSSDFKRVYPALADKIVAPMA